VSEDFVLVETLSSQRQGRPLYLAGMSAIGPYTTPDLDEALRFDTEEAASRHPAAFHPLTFFETRAANSHPRGDE
jgi:hypothetical protein